MKSCFIISFFIFWITFSMLSASILKCPNNLLSPFQTFLKISSSQCPPKMISSLSDWKFSQPSSLLSFPIDPITENYARRVPKCIFSRVTPQPLKSELSLVSSSDDVLEEVLDLDPQVKSEPLFANFIAGNELLPGCDPMAHRYGGFQFGYWADQLGDGRAILLGEYINRKGERWELQLKGAGKTPYSRNGDGRAVLRSSIREFLASEAMEALGIATSRAAGLVVSKVAVIRDQFYNGRVKAEPAAVVLRLAKSWFRIGSLEILQRENELDNLKLVTDFVIKNCYPELGLEDYLQFFEKMVNDSALLVAKWMTVGFAHGVLNTDNMSLISITIDYGPYGFLDAYEPGFIPNHSDDAGRYSYENQPRVFKWNLGSLARAIAPLVTESDRPKLGEILSKFETIFEEYLMTEFRKKFGLSTPHPEEAKLIQMFLDMMEIRRADFTQTFRQLSKLELTDGLKTDFDTLWALKSISAHPNFAEFVALYRRVTTETGVTETDRRNLMDRTNPQYVLRNWMAESAIRAAQGDGSGNSTNQQPDFGPTNLLLKILKRPYEVDPEAEASGFSGPPPSWSCSLKVSCSS